MLESQADDIAMSLSLIADALTARGEEGRPIPLAQALVHELRQITARLENIEVAVAALEATMRMKAR